MRHVGPVQFVFLHDDSDEAIARGQALTDYGRKLVARIEAATTAGMTYNSGHHQLPDGSEVSAYLVGGNEATGAMRQYKVVIRTKAGGGAPRVEKWPYLWAGARWMYEEVGGHWTEQPDRCVMTEFELGMEVFEPLPEENEPAFGPSDQLHVTSWNYQETDFPWRHYWQSSPDYMENRHNNNPGVWSWSRWFYEGGEWADHPANTWAGPLNENVDSPMWVTYTDRWMYQTNWALTASISYNGIEGPGLNFPTGSMLYVPSKDANGNEVDGRFAYPDPREYPPNYLEELSWGPFDPTDPKCLAKPYPWSVVTVLDPFEGQPTLPDGSRNFPTDDRPYRAWKDIHAAGAIHGVTAYGASQVRPGKYVIKVFVRYNPCLFAAGNCVLPPIELKVMVGKAPYTSTETYRIELERVADEAMQCYAYGRNLCWPDGASCCAWDRWPNVKDPNYWQDAVIADVSSGRQVLASEADEPAWPETKDPAFMDEPLPHAAGACEYANRYLIVVGSMPFISYWQGRDQQADEDGPELHPDDGMPQAFAKIVHEFQRRITGARAKTPLGEGMSEKMVEGGDCVPGPPEDCPGFRRAVESAFRQKNPTNGTFALRYDPINGKSVEASLTTIPMPDVFDQDIDFDCVADSDGLDGCKNWPDWMRPYICESYSDQSVMWWYSLGQSGELATHVYPAIKRCGVPPRQPSECCTPPPESADGSECGGVDVNGWLP